MSATVPLGTSGVFMGPLLVTGFGSCWSVALGMVCGCPSWFLKSLRGPRAQIWHGLHRPHDFFSYFFLSCFPQVFLKASGRFLSRDDRFGCQNDVKNRLKIYQKSIKKRMLKMIPDNVQKSLKSDAPDFGKSSKTTVLSSIFVVSTHVH